MLLAAAVAALIASNSPLARLYDGFLDTPVGVRVGPLALDKPLLLWINDGLMAIFFFLVGLEIKRELLRGELSTFGQAALPAVAAIGGMAVPALIYVAINWGNPAALRGWAIPPPPTSLSPSACSRCSDAHSASLKIFLLALAIIDDLGAILSHRAVLHRASVAGFRWRSRPRAWWCSGPSMPAALRGWHPMC